MLLQQSHIHVKVCFVFGAQQLSVWLEHRDGRERVGNEAGSRMVFKAMLWSIDSILKALRS